MSEGKNIKSIKKLEDLILKILDDIKILNNLLINAKNELDLCKNEKKFKIFLEDRLDLEKEWEKFEENVSNVRKNYFTSFLSLSSLIKSYRKKNPKRKKKISKKSTTDFKKTPQSKLKKFEGFSELNRQDEFWKIWKKKK